MRPSEEFMKIAGKFVQFTQKGDKTLISDIPLEKLEIAFIQYSRDKGDLHYSAMEMRIKELKEEKTAKRSSKKK